MSLAADNPRTLIFQRVIRELCAKVGAIPTGYAAATGAATDSADCKGRTAGEDRDIDEGNAVDKGGAVEPDDAGKDDVGEDGAADAGATAHADGAGHADSADSVDNAHVTGGIDDAVEAAAMALIAGERLKLGEHLYLFAHHDTVCPEILFIFIDLGPLADAGLERPVLMLNFELMADIRGVLSLHPHSGHLFYGCQFRLGMSATGEQLLGMLAQAMDDLGQSMLERGICTSPEHGEAGFSAWRISPPAA
jgi:hypothetical protein